MSNSASFNNNASQALDWLAHAYQQDRLAHAYLLIGPPEELVTQLVYPLLERLLGDRFHTATQQKGVRSLHEVEHPDLFCVEPQSKGRFIPVEEVRRLEQNLQQTPYRASNKVGIVVEADRLYPNAAHAFLKTLEEPPAHSLLLLLTAYPENLLPTVRSRCQSVRLFVESAAEASDWEDELAAILARGVPGAALEVAVWTQQVVRLVQEKQDEVETAVKEEVKEASQDLPEEAQPSQESVDARIHAATRGFQTALLERMMDWYRDVLVLATDPEAGVDQLQWKTRVEVLAQQAQQLQVEGALQTLDTVQGIARRLDRNLNTQTAFFAGGLDFIAPKRLRV